MIIPILTLIFAFLTLVVLMIIHEYGHFITAKKFGVKVDEFGIGYPPKLFGKKFGETLYSINLIPLGAFVKIRGEEGGVEDSRSFTSLPIWKRSLIVIGGVAAFWIVAMIIFSVVFFMGADLPIGDDNLSGLANPRIIVLGSAESSPADKAGLMAGDIIESIGMEDGSFFLVDKVKDFQDAATSNKGKEITLGIKRREGSLYVNLVPRSSAPEGEGLIGVQLERVGTLVEKSPWYLAPFQGIIYTGKVTVGAIVGLYQVFRDLILAKGLPEGAELAGPIGITIFLANALSYGPGFFLYFIGLLSVFVAIFNLFPIPALDGGKLVFLLIEKIKGKPVSPIIEQKISIFFFVLLISLSLFITVKFDFPRFAEFFS